MRVMLCLMLCCQMQAQPPDSVVTSAGGVVVSRSTEASKVGLEILDAGGNAVDAAVAMGFALAVTYPAAGNLGGGGFMIIRQSDGEVFALDFREKAPSAAAPEMYLDEQGKVIEHASRVGHRAAGVPGTPHGFLNALERFGSLPRARVLRGAIHLAESGFLVPRDVARQIREEEDLLRRFPQSAAITLPQGQPRAEGTRWVQSELAETLKRLALYGVRDFYQGDTARLIIEEMVRGHGLIDGDDLKSYTSQWREPIHGVYRDVEIWSMPPPSSGGVLLLQMLNMLEPYDLASMGHNSAATIHLMVEAERRAYADRATHLGDPDFAQLPVAQLIAKPYARKRMANFDPKRASVSPEIASGVFPQESPDTTHFSVVDRQGNAVSCTTTLNLRFGCGIVVKGAGFFLNNEMDDFSVKPGVPNAFELIGGEKNAIAPHKRMLSSMTPTVVTRQGELYMVLGSPGGSTIITTVLQVLINRVDHGMSPFEAVAAPRFHHQWLPDTIQFEFSALNPDTHRLLEAMGHQKMVFRPTPLGDANSVFLWEGQRYGITDPRYSALPLGQ